MKKLRKMDSKLSQSVIAFACPCIGSGCQTCVYCGCSGSSYASQMAFESGKAAISTIALHGLQTANLNG